MLWDEEKRNISLCMDGGGAPATKVYKGNSMKPTTGSMFMKVGWKHCGTGTANHGIKRQTNGLID